ncbi:MAG: flagellar export protein FliJ [Alphaproteobacteria bacterium]|nr:flagellar export protein FliJ [Alphaproteobacteria bacterium]
MKSLETLLKVAKRRLDDLGIEAAKLSIELDNLRAETAVLAAREQSEVELASTDLQLLAMMPAYRQRMAQQIGAAQQCVVEKEAQLEAVRERLTAAYQEKSKFEELLERERLRAEMARSAAEQAALDEAAINRVGRD